MHNFYVFFTALTVFGVGVTIVDLFGVFEHGTDSSPEGDMGSSGGHGLSDHGDQGDDAGQDDGSAEDGDVALAPHSDASDHFADHDDSHGDHDDSHGSTIVSADAGARVVANTISMLRLAVYFSLGAGPTGLFGLLTGHGLTASLVWSAGAGTLAALISRSLRKFVRKDIDSSIKPEEYLLDEGVVIVPIAPGSIGKVSVRRYGKETELYVKCKDGSAAIAKGTKVRIVDYDDEFYYVEGVE